MPLAPGTMTATVGGLVPTPPNVATQFLNGTGAFSTPAAGGSTDTKVHISGFFETAARYGTANTNGTETFSNGGCRLQSSATSGSYGSISWLPNGTSPNLFDNNPTFTTWLKCTTVQANGSGQAFFGIGNIGSAGTGLDYTTNHVGFKLVKVASTTVNLYATQSGGTETASASLTTISDGDYLELVVVITSSTSADYYYRLNAGAQSSKTTLSTNLPQGSTQSDRIKWSISNVSTATNNIIDIDGFSYAR